MKFWNLEFKPQKMAYKAVKITDPHKQKHFEFFNDFDQPHFNITANVDITNLRVKCKELGLSFTPVMVYCISRVANDIPEFRQRIRDQAIIEHDAVNPSFSIDTEVSNTFSFCPVAYDNNFDLFYDKTVDAMARFRKHPVFEDEPDRDDYLFLSAIPWVAFTGFVHAMHHSPADSVPRIVWGKFFTQGDRTLMPLSVQVHHAVADGQHVGLYFNQFEDLVSSLSFLKKK